MTLLEGQIEHRKALIAYWQTCISSGAYKLKKMQTGTGENDEKGNKIWRTETDEEALERSMGILKRHVEILGETIEHLPSDYDFVK